MSEFKFWGKISNVHETDVKVLVCIKAAPKLQATELLGEKTTYISNSHTPWQCF